LFYTFRFKFSSSLLFFVFDDFRIFSFPALYNETRHTKKSKNQKIKKSKSQRKTKKSVHQLQVSSEALKGVLVKI